MKEYSSFRFFKCGLTSVYDRIQYLVVYFLLFPIVMSFSYKSHAAPQYSESELSELEKKFEFMDFSGNSEKLETAYILCSSYTISGNRENALKYADILMGMSATEMTEYEKLSVYAYSAQAYLAFDKYHKADSVLRKGFYVWNEIEKGTMHGSFQFGGISNPTAVAILFNAAGVYAVNVEMNYERATEYFLQGMKFARTYLKSMDYAALSCNLLMTYFIRNNPEGLVYAQEVYNDGVKEDDMYLRFIGAYELSMMYYIDEDYDSAEKYILEAINSEIKVNTVYVYNMYANILYKTGREEEAGQYYLKAMSELEGVPVTIASYVCLSYGTYLLEKKETDKAISILTRGLDIAMAKENKVFTYQLNKSLSEAYSRKGMYKEALKYYINFHQESDSIFNLKRERTIGQLMLKYRTALYESQVKEKDIQLMKKNRTLIILLAVVLMVILVSVILWIINRKTNAMYTRIVRQYQNAISEQKKLSGQLEWYKSQTEASGNDSSVSQSDGDAMGHAVEIADKLEYLMNQKHIYTDNTLSREKLAELAGTNRTYLTKIIKEHFNKSVNQYINSYRINKAIEILSNDKTDIPMKSVELESGFSSSSNFFKLFKEEVGMSPAKFREKVLEISSGK